jgi:hypothetical protein
VGRNLESMPPMIEPAREGLVQIAAPLIKIS